ncbi:ribosomal protein S18-alanine N-acetyltransferase [Conyzicola nivalis]|uniref:Ribosomal-protein-alanine acetyltransferase n=1 Tax=Conyzicola nivalis TaxID=1477021 RepID=A0A916WMG9_9MICO|nr:ribosomal protein S18-alanine N-acetyltransferase [Conyzicola nivalis]GGB12188.1 ribosomal-protein-alanine acetyltransferase [Conyzicola nivalis]
MAWQLRSATPDDLDAIMAIEHAVFPSDAWSRESMLAELSNRHTHYLVAFDLATPDEFVAYAGLLAPRGATQADIQSVAVVETARRRGLARTLVQTLIAEARDRGAREVFLEVRVDNPNAQSLYDSLGFERIAVRKGYYQPDNVDGAVMRLEIPEPKTRPAVGQ